MSLKRALIPIIITPREYRYGINVQNNELEFRELTTIYKSTGAHFCNYVSFAESYPSTKTPLSWLFPQPGVSVIQFATSQLHYRIKWKLTNNGSQTVSKRVRYLTVDAKKQIAPEPWDIEGKRIEMIVPSPGATTSGSFTMPGQYLFFVIEDPNRSLEVELKVTAYIPKTQDPWIVHGCGNASNFYSVNCKGETLLAYRNQLSENGVVTRQLNPCLRQWEKKILERYYQNAGQPCFLSACLAAGTGDERDFVRVNYAAVYTKANQRTQLNGCSASLCCNRGYLNPELTIDVGEKKWVTPLQDKTQFQLDPGRYQIQNLSLEGLKPRYEDFLPSYDADNYRGPLQTCENQTVRFVFYDVSGFDATRYSAERYSTPLIRPLPGRIVFDAPPSEGRKFEIKFSHNDLFEFDVGETHPYAIRVERTFWYFEEIRPSEQGQPYLYVVSPKELNFSFDVVKIR